MLFIYIYIYTHTHTNYLVVYSHAMIKKKFYELILGNIVKFVLKYITDAVKK